MPTTRIKGKPRKTMGSRYILGDQESPQTLRVEECVGFGDAAARLQGFQVTEVGALLPCGARRAHEFVDAVGPQPLGLGGQRVGAELVEGDVGGDVLGAGRVERVATAAVLSIGPQPL